MRKPKNFEEGIARLDAILETISAEDTALNDALKLYGEAAELVSYCNTTLDAAQLQIEEIDAKLQAGAGQEDLT